MSKLLMLKGLPASGKSTYAKELVAKGWKRVNKDDLRAMIDNGKWSRDNESWIKDLEEKIVVDFLLEGYDVVVDSTNFAHEERWKKKAYLCDAEFEVKFFDTPLMECIERDALRGDKKVGHKVIYRMYEQYLKPKKTNYVDGLQPCYIFDIDGTIAHSIDRSPYDYSKVSTDVVNEDIVRILKNLEAHVTVFLVSGRDGVCEEDTKEWLRNHDIPFSALYMRTAGDSRKDSIVKQEIYENHIKGNYNVLGVFDDRNQVVDLWRSLGLTCLQVGYGFF